MITKSPGSRPGTIRVVFQFPGSIWLNRIHLVGDFNQWDPHSLPLERASDQPQWQITLELEQGRSYQFRYLIDDATWCNDWNADAYVPNPFGGYNSVVVT